MSDQLISYREESKRNYSSKCAHLSDDQLKTGALMRIADSVEIIAKDREALIRENDRLKHRVKEMESSFDWMERSRRRYLGLYKQIKNKLEGYKL